MKKFNEVKLHIEFEFSSCNSKFMILTVNNNTVSPDYPFYTCDIMLPEIVKITTSGKDHRYDTIIDKAGNIVEDLFVRIKSISLNNIPLSEVFLHQKIKIKTENGDVHTTSYFGYNGEANLEFLENNIFSQISKANKSLRDPE